MVCLIFYASSPQTLDDLMEARSIHEDVALTFGDVKAWEKAKEIGTEIDKRLELEVVKE